MKLPEEGKLLRIFIGEGDMVHGKPLFEAIVLKARELNLAGATVVRGGELTAYKQTKSAIHFPFKSQIPVELIREIIRFTAITNLEKAEQKKHIYRQLEYTW